MNGFAHETESLAGRIGNHGRRLCTSMRQRASNKSVSCFFSQELKNSRTQELKNSRTQELKNSRTQELKNSRTQELKNSRRINSPAPPAPVGMRSRASGAARLDASFCCFVERALALSELRLFPSAPSLRL